MDAGPVIISTVLFVVCGAVLVLRPISMRLGAYLEVLAQERRRERTTSEPRAIPAADAARLATALETLDRRLAHLEERQEFTDALLSQRNGPVLPRPANTIVGASAENR